MIFFYWLISVMPLTQHPLWAKLVGELTLIKYLGLLCLLFAVLHLAASRTAPPFFGTRQAVFFLLFAFLAILSYTFLGQKAAWGMSPLLSYTSFLLLFFITLSVVDSLERLRWVLLVAIGSAAFASLYVLREWQKYHAVYSGFRPGWVVGDPNYFTLSAILCLPLAFYLIQEKRPRWEKLFCLGCLVVTLLAVMLAASRGGFLGTVTAFLFVVWRSRRRVRNMALAGLLLIPLSLAAPASPIERFLNPSRGDQEAVDIRTALWKAGWGMIQAHPLAGIGVGNFKSAVGRYAAPGETLNGVAHNTYVEITAEMGLPGLLLFLGILYWSYRTLDRVGGLSLDAGPALLHQAALGIQAGLLGFAVAAFFVSAEYQKFFWLMVFLSMCMVPLASRHIGRTAPRPGGAREA